jgi:hypothetical protein
MYAYINKRLKVLGICIYVVLMVICNSPGLPFLLKVWWRHAGAHGTVLAFAALEVEAGVMIWDYLSSG